MIEAGKTLAKFVAEAGTVTVLTGAGVSTNSGIPGYRDEDGNWKHARPVQFADFVGSAATRQRYWARSHAGWRRFSRAAPNGAHHSLARLESLGLIDTLVTQNVDGLHRAAGSQKLIDLHGNLDRVACLSCRYAERRDAWQERLTGRNPRWQATVEDIKPDGDVELENDYREFVVPGCPECQGIVKPDVVFFGESVPKNRVEEAGIAVDRSGALLVVGSSLMVFSGLRFVRRAVEKQKPVAIVNLGRTRGDPHADLKLEGDCGDVLDAALQRLDRAGALP